MASSGRATRSAPASSAALMAARIRSTLPARSPTTVLICAAATRRRAIPRDYGVGSSGSVTWNTPGAMSTVLPVLKSPEVVEVIDRAAAPRQARLVLTRLLDAHPELAERLASDRLYGSALVALSGASRSLLEAVKRPRGVAVPLRPEGAGAGAGRVARYVITTMAQPTPYGIVFRTDADLRPEGRAGPLSRSLGAYKAYWEKWASNWEFQALIKARPVAGDAELGVAFMVAAQPHVWPERLDPDAGRESRMMKARAEQEVSKRGLAEREIKRGRGGLRDIEFAVQLLQLVHGRHDPGIRSPNTLEALEQLGQAGYVDTTQVRTLDAAYRFLRTVEHRLQLAEEGQVHALPSDTAGRTHVARVLGYRDEGSTTALERFAATHRRHQAQVRSIHEKLFFRPLLEAIAGTGPLSQQAVEDRLAALGFLHVAHPP